MTLRVLTMKKISNVREALEIYSEFVRNNNFEDIINEAINNARIPDLNNIINNINVLFASPTVIKNIARSFCGTQLCIFIRNTKEQRKKIFTEERYKELELQYSSFIDLAGKFNDLYDTLTNKQNGVAYQMIQALGVRACPYCNLNYIDPVITDEGTNVVRHHLDHFYPKKYFPFLAVSFYNLIPSCYECNSGLKRAKIDFNLYNPFLDDFDSDAKFVIFLTGDGSISSLFNDINSFDINIKSKSIENIASVSNYINSFCLEDRYKYRKEEAREILCHKALATPYLIQEIRRQLKLNNISDEQIKSILLRNYLEGEDINKRPLSKLTQDIMKYN